ncbi:MAG: hypothetical protein JO320_01690 [Alphaproteobacteria bacterium]|nr:hypothetical protein [Alphaproteobacteria bacterium]MBV9373768.1 hypothetical protein [Alphaproteobacteria bacterium]
MAAFLSSKLLIITARNVRHTAWNIRSDLGKGLAGHHGQNQAVHAGGVIAVTVIPLP